MFDHLRRRKAEREVRRSRELAEDSQHFKFALALENKRGELIEKQQELKHRIFRATTDADKEKYENELREINQQEYELRQVIKSHEEKRRK